MILVTGAAGLCGSTVIREFARHNTPVRALVRSRAKASAFETLPNVEIAEGDMLHAESLGAALAGVDRALMISSSNQGMVETQCAFIDAAKQAGVRHVVKLSGMESGIDFEPKNFRFTRMHEEIERYLERSGLAWTHLRPSQFMQVYFREGASIARDGAFYLPMENARLSPIDIEDIAKIAYKLLNSAGGHEAKSYDMTGPEALTMTEVAERLSQALEGRFAMSISRWRNGKRGCWREECPRISPTRSMNRPANAGNVLNRGCISARMSCLALSRQRSRNSHGGMPGYSRQRPNRFRAHYGKKGARANKFAWVRPFLWEAVVMRRTSDRVCCRGSSRFAP